VTRPRILIADDHKIVVEGIKKLLAPYFDIAGIVEDGRELVSAVSRLRPDVIIADISMPMLNGIEAVRQIKKSHEEIKVVFLTMHPDVTYALNAFKTGASGYVLKHSAPDELVTAIREVLNGRTYVTPLIAGRLLQAYRDEAAHPEVVLGKFTPRQREVLQLLAEGHSVKQIATILNISIKTVEYHKYRMMEELDFHSVDKLVRYAKQHGLPVSDPPLG
jgi:DNA-binding NarL/FixJ family response regulator